MKFKSKIDRIFYPKNGIIKNDDWGIVAFDLDEELFELIEGRPQLNSYGNLSIVGTYPELNYDKVYTVIAKEGVNHKNEFQYELVFIFEEYNFDDNNDKRIFLEKILTETQINQLYDCFDDPFELIKNKDMDELTKVKGLGVKTVQKIFDKYDKSIDYSYAYLELDDLGLSQNMVKKLTDTYGSPERLVHRIKENPYIISDEVEGIGWKKSDSIARKKGIAEDSVFRIEAYVKYYLNKVSQKGDSYVDPAVFAEDICTELKIERPLLAQVIRDLYDKGILYWTEEKSFIALQSMYNLEKVISEQILRILNQQNIFNYEGYELMISTIEKEQKWDFTTEQRNGIKTILDNNLVVLTGYSGTGKSTLLKAVTTILSKHGYTFGQCALAGKASSRIEEVTGFNAETIHRLLKFNPKTGFQFNEYNPLSFDVIIVDEVSMIGGELFYQLIKAVKNGAKLILVGDDGQLESIGVLNLFYDLLNSTEVPSVRLTQIHRQAQNSAIITDSIAIRKGKQILERGFVGNEVRGVLQDLIINAYDEKEYVAPSLLENFKMEYEKLKDINKIQIIVPMRENGDSSVYAINQMIQSYVNPKTISGKYFELGGGKKKPYILKVGDKVVNKKNNYKTVNYDFETTPVFNGNFGIIEEIDVESGMMLVNFDVQGKIFIPRSHWLHIELGYACTVHSSQGSQWEVVLCGIDYSSYIMLTRELVYTAITRAQKRCYLCCQTSALSYAINNSQVPEKKTFMQNLLKESEQN